MSVSQEIHEISKRLIEDIGKGDDFCNYSNKYKLIQHFNDFYVKGIRDGQQSVMKQPHNFLD
jgi:hypothetical protein